MRYKKHKDGETFAVPAKAIYRIACCDCGLIHDFVFIPGRGKVYITAARNERATAQRRRNKQFAAKGKE